MAKIDFFQQKNLNPADELRQIINTLEENQPRLKSLKPEDALGILRDLDRANELFTQLQDTGVDLKSEQGRFEAVQGQLVKQAGRWLKALGGANALIKHRPSPLPPADERWWWYINEEVTARRKHALRKLVIGGVALITLVCAVIVAFQTILAPSPEAIARLDAENNSRRAFEEGDIEGALTEIRKGLAVVPDDPGLIISAGIYQELLGDQTAANQRFEKATKILGNPELFYLGRAQLYLMTGQAEKAEQDAQTGIEINENSARGWLLLGQALEGQGNTFEAIPAYEQAGELALANGDNEIVVLARMSLGRLLSAPPVLEN